MTSPEKFANEDPRWGYILNAIIEFASGNFKIPDYNLGQGDQLDALAEGIIMLGEELRLRTISNEYLANVYKGITDILLVLNNDLAIQEVNQSSLGLLEFSHSDLSKLNLSHICPEIIYRDDLRFKIRKKGDFNELKNLQLKLFTKSGRVLSVSASFSRIQGNWRDGHDILFVAKDISQLTKVQKHLQERNQELSTLIYRIAHDLRAPLSNVMGLVNMTRSVVEKGNLNKTEILELLSMMEVSTGRLDKILKYFNEILYIGEYDRAIKSVDFHQVLHGAVNQLTTDVGTDLFELHEKISVGNTVYVGPADLLRTMLFNLLHNSVVHRGAHLAKVDIWVEIKVKGHHIHIMVKDNG